MVFAQVLHHAIRYARMDNFATSREEIPGKSRNALKRAAFIVDFCEIRTSDWRVGEMSLSLSAVIFRDRRAKTCLSVVSRARGTVRGKSRGELNAPGEWISCGRSPIRENRMIDRAKLPPRRSCGGFKRPRILFVRHGNLPRETKRVGAAH